MAIKASNIRINVTISRKLYAKLRFLSEGLMTMSELCNEILEAYSSQTELGIYKLEKELLHQQEEEEFENQNSNP